MGLLREEGFSFIRYAIDFDLNPKKELLSAFTDSDSV